MVKAEAGEGKRYGLRPRSKPDNQSSRAAARGLAVSSNRSTEKKKSQGPKLTTRERRELKLTRLCTAQTRWCAKPALALWNRDCRDDGVPEYQFVDAVTRTCWVKCKLQWYHANFTARPKDDTFTEPELFFAELKQTAPRSKNYDVTKVCKLGRSGDVTFGRNGCLSCSFTTLTILHHPPPGEFDVGKRMHMVHPNPARLYLSKEAYQCSSATVRL